MLRVLALLCSFALLLAPLGTAQAKPACAVLAVTQDIGHSAHWTDHETPVTGHPAQVCKQLCAVVATLAPSQPVVALSTFVRPSSSPVARLLEQPPPGPSERPPKLLV